MGKKIRYEQIENGNLIGSVKSVGISVPTGFSVSNSPVTTSGTITLTFASGYSLPTTIKQTNWDSAYNSIGLPLTNLNTVNKTNLVSAINEVNANSVNVDPRHFNRVITTSAQATTGVWRLTLGTNGIVGSLKIRLTGSYFNSLANGLIELQGGFFGNTNAIYNNGLICTQSSSAGIRGAFYIDPVIKKDSTNGNYYLEIHKKTSPNNPIWVEIDFISADNSIGYFNPSIVSFDSNATVSALTNEVSVFGSLTTGGTIYTPSHGNSSQWNIAYGWGDHKAYGNSTVTRQYLGGNYIQGGLEKPNFMGSAKLELRMLRAGVTNLGANVPGTWSDVLWMSSYSAGDVKKSTAIISSKNSDLEIGFTKQDYDATDWGTYFSFWHSGNFTPSNYALLTDLEDTRVFRYRGQLVNNSNAHTLNQSGFYWNTTGNGTGNTNFPSAYGFTMVLRAIDDYKTILNISQTGALTIRSIWSGATTIDRTVWDSANFTPSNYALLSQVYTQSQALSLFVGLNGVQTINDTKTFSSSPIVPNATLNNHAVNLGQLTSYVSDRANVRLSNLASDLSATEKNAIKNKLGVTDTTYSNGTGIDLTNYTFSLTAQVQNDINKGVLAFGYGNHASAGYALASQLANYVPVNGAFTINGTKTFSSSPIVPNATLNSHAVNLGQLNTLLANYLTSIPYATNAIIGGFKLFSNTQQTIAPNAVSATASRTYAVQLDSNGQAMVNVPWTNTNTTYSAGNGITLTGNTFSMVVNESGSAGSGMYVYSVTQEAGGIKVTYATLPDISYTLPTATSTVKGGVELFSDTVQAVASNAVSATTGRTYGVQLNSAGQMVVNVPWVSTDTVTQIGVNGSNYTFGNLNFINGTDIQVSKSGSNIRIDYIGTGGGSAGPTKVISLDTTNLTDDNLNNGFTHKGSYDFIESEANDQTGLVFFAVRRANGYWASPSDYAREFYGKMGVRFNSIEDYTTQGTVLLPEGFSSELHQFYEERKFYLVAFHDFSNSDFFHGWIDWDGVLNYRKNSYGGGSMFCILGKLIYSDDGKHSIDVDPKYF